MPFEDERCVCEQPFLPIGGVACELCGKLVVNLRFEAGGTVVLPANWPVKVKPGGVVRYWQEDG